MRNDCRSTKLGVLRPFGLYRQKLRQEDGDLIQLLEECVLGNHFWTKKMLIPQQQQQQQHLSRLPTFHVKTGWCKARRIPIVCPAWLGFECFHLKHRRHQRRYCFRLVSCRKDINLSFWLLQRISSQKSCCCLPSQLWLAGICNCKLCRDSDHLFLH